MGAKIHLAYNVQNCVNNQIKSKCFKIFWYLQLFSSIKHYNPSVTITPLAQFYFINSHLINTELTKSAPHTKTSKQLQIRKQKLIIQYNRAPW